MVNKTFDIVCELISVCDSNNYTFTLESNEKGDYRLEVHCAKISSSSARLLAGSFCYDILSVAHKYDNISACFNSESASLNFSILVLPFDDCEK